MRTPKLSISVIICAYSNERRAWLEEALNSVLVQSLPADEVIAVIDHNEVLREDVAGRFPAVRFIANNGPRGLSSARNFGVAAAGCDVVAFLDDDAVADRNWLSRLASHYDDLTVMGCGGGVIPVWPGRRPRWLPEEFNWVVGCSYIGQPDKSSPVRNPIGCNMSFRREVFERIGGFNIAIGREGADAAGCEETEFCIRARQAYARATILYDPAASVAHHVSTDRVTWKYFRKRCFAEGRSKRRMIDSVGTDDGLSSERRYVATVLPTGILHGLRDVVMKRDPWGLARAAGIVAGLGFTAAGYFSGRLRGHER